MLDIRRSWRRKVIMLACVVAVAFVAGALSAFWIVEETREMRPVSISDVLFKNDEDKVSFARLTEAMEIIEETYYSEVSGKQLFDGMLKGGVRDLDPHSEIALPDPVLMKEVAKMSGGIGIEIDRNPSRRLPGIVVISPSEGGPAFEAGIKAKDIIVEILTVGRSGLPEWRSTARMTIEEATSLLRGLPETTVEIKVHREGEIGLLTFKLVRSVLKVKSYRYELKEGGIGYIKIAQFDSSVAFSRIPGMSSVATPIIFALRDMRRQNGNESLKGLVLDLRNNPGGRVDVAEAILNLFLVRSRYSSDGAAVMVSQESRGVRKPLLKVGGSRDEIAGAPILVLINEGSASASELVAGVLQKHGRAIVAGPATSFGKGTVQRAIPLRAGGVLRMTISQYLVGPEGCEQPVQNIGITPDVFVKGAQNALEVQHESDLPGALSTSTVKADNCQHRFSVPEVHKDAAQKMLRTMELEPL